MLDEYEFPFSVPQPCYMVVEGGKMDDATGRVAFDRNTRFSTVNDSKGRLNLLLFATEDEAEDFHNSTGFGEACHTFPDLRELTDFCRLSLWIGLRLITNQRAVA
jgi:hypothetical protein